MSGRLRRVGYRYVVERIEPSEGDEMHRSSTAVSQPRRSGRRALRPLRIASIVGALTIALIPAASGVSAAARPRHTSGGGTATFALQVTDEFTWLFPYENAAANEPWEQGVENALWPPLYFEGDGASPTVDYTLSLAYPPVYSNNNKTVTIKLRHYLWSDGQPVTTRDIEFAVNIFKAGKSDIATYIPGDFPDNIASIDYVSPTEFVIHVTKSYSQQWFTDNELTQLVPLPQQTWDRLSTTGKVGNYDLTAAGAKRVFTFLYDQSKELSTYTTSPLWKTVDGPYTLTGYNSATGRTVLSANNKYTGPNKSRLSQIVLDTFTSYTAEVDELRSGDLDYGYIPYSDLGLKGYFESHGYTVQAWLPNDTQYAELGWTSKTYGPLVGQLYIRQALQHVVNEPLYLKTTFQGLGLLTYGPVPNLPGSSLVSPELRSDPDPYSIGGARSLLSSHGWKVGSSGYFVCHKPGTASNECGAKISAGEQLTLLMDYSTGDITLAAQSLAFQTAAKSAGIDIKLDPLSATTMISADGVCPPGPCNYAIAIYPLWFSLFSGSGTYPTNDSNFGKGNYWGGGYYSPAAQALMEAAETHTGLSSLYADENYLSRQIVALWFPTGANQISVVKNSLKGWTPQPPFGYALPENWYFAS
jgi:peptide/nickel transport system substrate-binding protein